ncbi:B12-binding domain-containing radical SAM protein [Streptomyces collinus]|uniref:B12-binding domain-containing radical SAM protein n=1 Tax=Streptomyces collinus TaxID=42684 RepID=UPI000995E23A|nr:radical SAM protein [Streptomyces collinus]UJA06419.1 B12-binding domain-containing radical SAM protein [Streptomyces collinus]UJA12411.1 B12-binding domain-containing radical SAM protein [Streptomyces collinus]UJA12710.1 B12-binding domain-containing radical SAM protein [Streptomyces collinus]UJA12726.1 B12-binding domain-containing radical SAM protein [Streptomyces collinus]UJA18712.1 B12-binding domain-containing radical SAM protein [Streptomyces collinus]
MPTQKRLALSFAGEGQVSVRSSTRHARVTLGRPLINSDVNSPFFVPLGLLCIASPLTAHGHPTVVVDLEYEHRIGAFEPGDADWLEQTCARFLAADPEILGLTCLADTLPSCLLIGREVKRLRPDVTVVLGGPGTFGVFPDALPRFADCVDFVCRGEGELAITALADAVADGADPAGVPGFWSCRNGQAASSGPQPTTNLNLVPMPAYDAVPMGDYIRLSTPHIFDVHIGSGCTYSCKFCMTSTFWDRDFRIKDPAVILDELRFLHRAYGVTQFNFLHDNFANKRTYLDEFVSYFAEHNDMFEWGCAVRPDNVNPSLLRRMADAGCFNIFCGTDAGSEKILKAMLKMPSTKRTYEFFRSAREVGIQFETNTIVGYPDESAEDLEKALEVVFDAIAYGAVNSDLSVLQPLPGAEITDEYRAELEPLESGLDVMGTFLPSDVRALIKDNPATFTGFSFIRSGNRDYAYYQDVLRLSRYFTRRYYHLLRFLKQGAGHTYVELIDALLARAAMPIEEALAEILAPMEGVHAQAARALFAYDSMLAEFRGDEVEEELVNVYRRPATVEEKPHFLIADFEVDIVTMISDPRDITWQPELSRPTVVVVYRASEAEVSTLRLTPAQAKMFKALMPRGRAEREALLADIAPGRLREVATAVAGLCARIDASPDAPAGTPPGVDAPLVTT